MHICDHWSLHNWIQWFIFENTVPWSHKYLFKYWHNLGDMLKVRNIPSIALDRHLDRHNKTGSKSKCHLHQLVLRRRKFSFWYKFRFRLPLTDIMGLSHERIFRRITRRVERFSIRSHTLNDLSFFRTVPITCWVLIYRIINLQKTCL